MHLQPYLMFDGLCDEAIKFYEQALGAKVQMLLRFGQNPDLENCAGTVPDDKVMHAAVAIGDAVVFMSDGRCTGTPKFDGFTLSLTMTDIPAADKTYAALLDGGETIMPLGETFFSPRFGMVKDRFGVHWMVMVRKA
ncbi:VOC family protein [bacterium]|nr:VOC family protein [bacterium]